MVNQIDGMNRIINEKNQPKVTDEIHRHMEAVIYGGLSECEFSKIIDQMAELLQGKNPTWRIQKDESMRGFILHMSAVIDG